MKVAIVTGAGGLIGSEAVEFFSQHFDKVIGIDNDMRFYFFGKNASVSQTTQELESKIYNFQNYKIDIRNYNELEKIFGQYNSDIKLVLHTAAQPSHDWATKEVLTDYHINSTSTLNLLELTRKYCENAVFLYTSTNKVYGDAPNKFNFIELAERFELQNNDKYYYGIDESLTIDSSKHSLFGCSKLSADIYVQEYGKYFGMNTIVFRGGCLTGSKQKGAELHGFLNYLVKCILENKKYIINGYKGKQVRDNIHSYDVIKAFYFAYLNPKKGEVYNIGGGRNSNCSILEAIKLIENFSHKKSIIEYDEKNRSGDHIWWITNMDKFKKDYPEWELTYSVDNIIKDIIENYK